MLINKKNISWGKILIILIFILATEFFIYQRYSGIGWDFAAYSLNGQYFFHGGSYFETIRPPLVPFFLGIFSFFGIFGEYLFILFVSGLFFYSCFKFSDFIFDNFKIKTLKKDEFRIIFYLILLSPFTLFYGLKEGTELLTLSFLMLFVESYINRRNYYGIFIALMILTRYSCIPFVIFLFIENNFKRFLKNFGLFLLFMLPWLIFNYQVFGNPFVSIIDSYVNNIFFRQGIIQPPVLSHFFNIWGIMIIFFLVGFIFVFLDIFKKSFDKKELFIIGLIFIIGLFTIYQYFTTPFKEARYLFNFNLCLGFFSSMAFVKLSKYKLVKILVIVLLPIYFVFSAFLISGSFNGDSNLDYSFRDAANYIEKSGLSNCYILSPHWVPVNYYSGNVYPLGGYDLGWVINESKIVLIFKNKSTFDDRFTEEDLNKNPVLYETEKYIFYAFENISSDNCFKKVVYDDVYVSNHCLILSKHFEKLKLQEFFYKMCDFITKKDNFTNNK